MNTTRRQMIVSLAAAVAGGVSLNSLAEPPAPAAPVDAMFEQLKQNLEKDGTHGILWYEKDGSQLTGAREKWERVSRWATELGAEGFGTLRNPGRSVLVSEEAGKQRWSWESTGGSYMWTFFYRDPDILKDYSKFMDATCDWDPLFRLAFVYTANAPLLVQLVPPLRSKEESLDNIVDLIRRQDAAA